jgi:hypothetical protein
LVVAFGVLAAVGAIVIAVHDKAPATPGMDGYAE